MALDPGVGHPPLSAAWLGFRSKKKRRQSSKISPDELLLIFSCFTAFDADVFKSFACICFQVCESQYGGGFEHTQVIAILDPRAVLEHCSKSHMANLRKSA